MSRAWPFVTLVAGFALGALTVWALRDDAPAPEPAPDPLRDVPADPVRTVRPPTPRAGRAAATGDRSDGSGAPPTSPRSAASPGAAAPTGARVGGVTPVPPQGAGGARDDRGGAVAGSSSGAAATSASAPPPGARSSVAAVSAAAAAAPVREASGVVVDAATQLPVAGARVLLAIADGPRAGVWFGDTTGEDGRFHPRVGDDTGVVGARMELRVSKDGYEPSVSVPAPGELRIELRTRGAPPLPGRVVGTARGADGRPIAGEIVVDGYDDHGGNASQFAIADAQGAYVLEGVPPGRWRLGLAGGKSAETTVAEGGEARADLVAPKPGEESRFTVTDVDPSTVKPADPVAAERVATLVRLLQALDPAAAPSLDDGTRERLRLAVAQEVQRLDAAARAALPRRDVVVTGLAAAIDGRARAWLRLEVKPRLFRRVEVQSGVARVPSVPIGTYTAVLVQPGRPEATKEIVVAPVVAQSAPPAESALTVAWEP